MSFENTLPNIDLLGDSITAGYPYLDENVRWWLGLKKDFNPKPLAITGSGLLYEKGGKNGMIIIDSADLSKTDSLVIFMGTNDYGNNIPLGTTDDLYPNDQTACGALNFVIDKIRSKNPKITIIGVLPIDRRLKGEPPAFGYETKNKQGYTLRELCETFKTVYEKKCVFCIDTKCAPINKYTIDELTADGLHPNKEGYKKLGQFLSKQLRSVINVMPETK